MTDESVLTRCPVVKENIVNRIAADLVWHQIRSITSKDYKVAIRTNQAAKTIGIGCGR